MEICEGGSLETEAHKGLPYSIRCEEVLGCLVFLRCVGCVGADGGLVGQ